MRYALLMYADPAHSRELTSEQLEEIKDKHAALRDELGASLFGGAGLALPDETTLVRPSGISTGPIGDTVEQLTAYYEIEASLERAQEIAARILDHHVTSVEVRRIHDHV
jgi:hypothetical protein